MRLVDGNNIEVDQTVEAITAAVTTQGIVSTDEDRPLAVQREDDGFSVSDDRSDGVVYESDDVEKCVRKVLDRLKNRR